METRLLIAYCLIGALLAATMLFVRHIVIQRREQRRIMRGHIRYKRAARESPDTSVTQP